MANLSEALASKITGSIKGAAGNFLGGVKGSFIGANPAVFGPMVAGLQKAFESQTKEIKKDREERKREKAFDEEKNNEQKKLFTDILGQLKEINDTLKNLLKAFTSKDKNPWKEMLTALIAMFGKFLEDLDGKLGKFISFLDEMFKSLKNTLENIGKLLSSLFEKLKGLLERLPNLDDIFKSLKFSFDDILRGLKLFFEDFKNIFKNLFKDLKTPKFLDDIFKSLKSSFEDILRGFKLFFEDFKNIFKDLKIPKFLEDIFKGLKSSFEDIFRGFKLFFEDFKNIFKKGIEDLGKFLRIDDLADAFRKFKNNFLVNMAVIGDQLDELGKSVKGKFLELTDIFKSRLDDVIKIVSESKIGRTVANLFEEIAKAISQIGTVKTTVPEIKLPEIKVVMPEKVPTIEFNLKDFPKLEAPKIMATEIRIGEIDVAKLETSKMTAAPGVEDAIKAATGADAVKGTAVVGDIAKTAGPMARILEMFSSIGKSIGSSLKFIADISDFDVIVKKVLAIAKPLGAIIGVFDGMSNALFNDKNLKSVLGKTEGQELTIADRLAAFAGGFLGSVFGIIDLLLDLMDIDLGQEVSEDMMGNMMGGKKRTVQGMVTDFLTKNISVVFNALKSMLVFFGQVLTSEPAMALYTKVGEVVGAVMKGFGKFIDFMKDFLFSDTMMKVYDVLLAGLKTTGQNAAAAFMGVLDIIIGIITFDTSKIMKGVGSVQDAVVAQVKNLANTVVDITKLMFGFIEDGVNWLINQLPQWLRPSTPFDLTGRYRMTAQDYEDSDLGAAMMRNASNARNTALAVSAVTGTNPIVGEYAAIDAAYNTLYGKTRGNPNLYKGKAPGKDFFTQELEEAVKNGTFTSLEAFSEQFRTIFAEGGALAFRKRMSPSAMDLWGQNAQYSKDQYFLSRDYYRNDESYRQERAQLQDQFNNNMIQMYRQAFSKMVGPMGFGGQTSRAGYNIANQPGIVQGFIRGGTKIFGDQMGAPMAYIFNSLAGNYLDQFINNTMAPALGMNAGQLNRSINNLIASRQFRPQMKQVERELANSRNELVKLEKETGFSMAELIKAGAAGGFNANQQQRYGALVSLRQQISQRETLYKSLKDQEKKYKDMALEDIIFGLSGVPTGIRSFLGYEQGLNRLAISLGMASASPFAPIFGTSGMTGMYGGARGFGGIGGGTMIGMPGGGMMAPSTIYGYPMMTSGGFNPYAPMGGMGGVPYGPYYSGPSQMPFMATFPGEQDILALESGMAGTPSAMSRLSRSMPAMVPLLSYALTRQLGNRIGVSGLLGNMAMMNVASPVISSLLGSLQMFGGQGIGSFSLLGSLSNALGLKGITGASTMGEIGMGVAGSINNLLGGGMIPGLAGLLTSGGSSLMSSALAQGAFGPAGFTSLGGQLGAGMANFGAGMTMGTGSLSGFANAMSTGGATAGGAIAGSLLGGLGAYGISSGLSGGYQINKNFDKFVGLAAMIPGLAPFAPLIGLGGALVNRMFGYKPVQTTDYGLSGDIGERGVNLSQYQNWSQAGGWFRSDRSGTNYSAIDAESIAATGTAIAARNALIRGYAATLGFSKETSEITRNFSQQISMSMKGLDEQGMVNAFRNMITSFSDNMIKSIFVGVEKFRFANEELAETMRNLAESTLIFDETMIKLGFDVGELSNLLGGKTLVDLAGFKQEFIGIFGGETLEKQREKFNQVVGTYFDIVYTETEKNMYIMDLNRRKMAAATETIADSLAAVQADVPEQLKGVMEFTKVLTDENLIDVSASLAKNYLNFKQVVDALMISGRKEAALTMMDLVDEFDFALKAFLNLEVEKQQNAATTEKIVTDIVEPFKDYVGAVSSSIGYTGEYGTASFGGAGRSYIDSVPYTPMAGTSISYDGIIKGEPASGTIDFFTELNNARSIQGQAGGGDANPLYIDNSVTSSSSSPTTIVMTDDKIRDYHPILNSNDRTLTQGFFVARS